MPYRFYITVTGKDQGPFKAEAGAGEGRSLGYRYRFRGSVNNDPTRAKGAAARSHEPLVIAKAWGGSSPQFALAFWTNEVLDVHLTFVHPEGDSKEKPFHEVELKNATIASIAHIAGDDAVVPDGAPLELEEIAFRFEKMRIRNVPDGTAAEFDFANKG